MKKLTYLLALACIFTSVLGGCAPDQSSSSAAVSATVTFTDSVGRTVTVDSPKRVAAAMGSFAEGWLLAGGELCAVTEDAFSERGLALSEETQNLGSMKTPSAEAIIAAEPDFLLLSSDIQGHLALKDTLDAAAVPYAYFSVETFDDYLSMLKTLTTITGRPDLYQKNGTAIKMQIEDAVGRCAALEEAPTVLLLRAYSTGIKAKGSDNMTGAMLADLGCINIADQDISLLEDLNLESIILADPDYIFITTMGASEEAALAMVDELLVQNPAFAALDAVEDGRCIVLEKDLFHYKPNARWGESYEKLANILCGDE